MALRVQNLFGPASERTGRLVLLNGTPSSGKTTLARALQAELSTPFYHHSLDEFRQGYPVGCWRADSHGELFRRVLDVYVTTLRTFVLLGHDVISEAVITPQTLDRYLGLFEDVPVLFIGIQCPLPEVERRERTRTDRHAPSPPPLDEAVHAHGCYDLEVDTARYEPVQAARLVAEIIAQPPDPTAFDRLRAQRPSAS